MVMLSRQHHLQVFDFSVIESPPALGTMAIPECVEPESQVIAIFPPRNIEELAPSKQIMFQESYLPFERGVE